MQGAAATAKSLKQKDPNFRFAILKNDRANEAMLDFLLFPGTDIEFHALKYAPAPGGKGLVAAEYRHGFRHGELDVDGVKKLRKQAIDSMARFDLSRVDEYFGLK